MVPQTASEVLAVSLSDVVGYLQLILLAYPLDYVENGAFVGFRVRGNLPPRTAAFALFPIAVFQDHRNFCLAVFARLDDDVVFVLLQRDEVSVVSLHADKLMRQHSFESLAASRSSQIDRVGANFDDISGDGIGGSVGWSQSGREMFKMILIVPISGPISVIPSLIVRVN